MPAIRGLTVCVGEWYANLLPITLWANMRHLTACYVVTTPEDEATKAVARSVPDVHVFETDAFTRPDSRGVQPRFNKGLAIEECFQHMGREGWIAVWDCDCIWPPSLPLDRLRVGRLHGMKRRILDDPSRWHPGLDWGELPLSHDGGPIGFFQLAHAEDPVLADKRPWYAVGFAHAAGGDHHFLHHWAAEDRVVLPAECLHLGPKDRNWFGADEQGRAMLAEWRRRVGWHDLDPDAPAWHGEIVDRVDVPGDGERHREFPVLGPRRAAR